MNRLGLVLILNACMWGVVIIACSYALKGTESFQEIQHILGGGVIGSLLIIAGGMRRKGEPEP